MAQGLTATSSMVIDAEPAAVWAAVTDLDQLSRAFFGAHVETDWHEGSPITFSGEWNGKSFQDKGEIVRVDRGRVLRFTHFSPLSGQPDTAEHYHTITLELTPRDGGTELTLNQTNAASEEERQHSEQNWGQVLHSIKEAVEG